MIKPNFKLENKLLNKGYDFIIGIDEAGRGPLAGPVVAAAVSPRNLQFVTGNLDKSNPNYELLITNYNLIRDSKTLSHKQRENLHDFIHEHFYVGVGICDHRTIDRMNILQATFLAMKKAITNLVSSIKYNVSGINEKNSKYIMHDTKYIILLDGSKPIPDFSGEQKAIINGDKLVKSISAASIIAKVTRDRIMIKMHKKYPHYHFHKHKGYGTKLHMKMLEKHGPCKIHRRSFKPVKKLARKKR